MKHPVKKAIGLAALLLSAALGGNAAATTVNYSDGTFDMANYTSKIAESPSGITSAPTQTPFGNGVGDTAAAQATFNNPSNPNFYVLVGLLRSDFNYTPAVNGPLGSIDVSLDRYFQPVIDGINGSVGNFTLRTFIEQGGQYFQAITSFPGGAGGTWVTLAADDLTAIDFGLYNFATDALDSTSHPDFGQAITAFGFGMRATGAGCPPPATTCTNSGTLRADNWSLVLTSADNPATVPEPGSFALMGLGLAAVAAARRRKQGPG